MRKKTDVLLVWFSFSFGAFLSLFLMHYLFGGRIYTDYDWRFLAPGYRLFGWYRSPILMTLSMFAAILFETVVFGGIIYASLRLFIWISNLVIRAASHFR